jgi:transposase
MKKGILEVANSRREDDQQYTVEQRAFETVLRCLDEPLHVASPAQAACESTKKILKKNRHPLGGCRREGKEVQQKGDLLMQVIYQRCAGIDVHLRFLVVCLSIVEAGVGRKEIRSFRNETADLLALGAWLLQEGCTHVGMESTGIYWRALYQRLEGFFELVVANAQHIKAVPGRKTDVQDADWIADLLQHGLLTASFVPAQEQQDLRDLTRLRVSLGKSTRSPGESCPRSVLEEAGIKLSTVLSDVMGQSGRAILEALG